MILVKVNCRYVFCFRLVSFRIYNYLNLLLQSALSNLEEMKSGRSDAQIVYRERGRNMGVGGPMRSRPVEKRIDRSPYSSGPYLSPPPTDTSWRRTNSDSALHTSAQTTDSLHSPGSQRRGKFKIYKKPSNQSFV